MSHSTNAQRQFNELSRKYSILANCNRLAIVSHLNNREMGVCELADAVGLSQPALSQHLQKMKEAGLVEARKQGQTRYYALSATLMASTLGNALIQELTMLGL